MTNEQINIAIAEACGWNDVRRPNNEFGRRAYGWIRTEHGNRTLETQIPDYCNDLNAMHEAEGSLNGWKIDTYIGHLYESNQADIISPNLWERIAVRRSTHATARQRAEAFLKTIGKWEGAK